MVLAHARALLTSSAEGRCAYIDADIRDPENILDTAAEVIDFTEPVGVVLMAVLQFVPDDDNPYELVRRLMAAVPAGSYLVISHPAADLQAAAMAGMATRLNQLMAQRVKPRTKAEVTAFFDGLDLVEPGVIRVPEWRPDHPEDAAGKSTMWGGVAEKRPPPQGRTPSLQRRYAQPARARVTFRRGPVYRNDGICLPWGHDATSRRGRTPAGDSHCG